MRPNTPHYVLTQEDSLVYGRHFYCGTSVFDNCVGLVQALLADQFVTNTTHPELLPFLASLNVWFNDIQYENPYPGGEYSSPSLPCLVC